MSRPKQNARNNAQFVEFLYDQARVFAVFRKKSTLRFLLRKKVPNSFLSRKRSAERVVFNFFRDYATSSELLSEKWNTERRRRATIAHIRDDRGMEWCRVRFFEYFRPHSGERADGQRTRTVTWRAVANTGQKQDDYRTF